MSAAPRRATTSYCQNDTSGAHSSWCVVRDTDYQESGGELIIDFADVVGKNGSMLLEVGPTADGRTGATDRRLLEGIGDWMSANGEAIHSTEPSLLFGKGPTEPPGGLFMDTAASRWTAADVPFTSTLDRLYAIVLRAPGDGSIRIDSLGTDMRLLTTRIRSVSVLGSATNSTWSADPDACRSDSHRTWTGTGPSASRC